ncbi:chaperonin 10-like protein [Diaporthe sp. PMI_573]|nr:chaperonin 10-like protein [Diaporthaceae sp. PMI_573]
MASQLPQTHQAVYLPAKGEPTTLVTRETPRAGPGSAVVRVLSAYVLAYANEIYGNKRPHSLPTPFVPGSGAICRVEEVGPDATSVFPGQLVLFDMTIRARDNPDEFYLSGALAGMTEASYKFSQGEFRDSTYAEYARIPLENCLPLDEQRLVRDLGYTIEDLTHLIPPMVPFGGLRDVGLRAGETVLVSPATGKYGGAAVHAALALGARVIAMGRNENSLERLVRHGGGRVSTVRITGDADADAAAIKEKAGGMVDVWMDISPPEASGSSHFKSCIQALRYGGRISLMGAALGVSLDISDITRRAATVKGTVMCTRDEALQVIRMAEVGVLPLGPKAGLDIVGKFGLDSFQSALETAAQHNGPGEMVVVTP